MMGQDATAKARLLGGSTPMCIGLEIYGLRDRAGDCQFHVSDVEASHALIG